VNPGFSYLTWAPELGALVALTTSGRIGVSRDAVTWSFYSVTNVLWSSVCWAPELRTLCAVASTGNNSQQIMTTTVESTVADGITYDGEWLQIRLPKAAAPTSYTLAVQSGARMPKSWTVLGSTSPGIWKLLDRQTNVPSFTNQTQRTFTIQKPQKVESIRVVINKVQGGYAYTDVPDLRYVAFYDQDTPLNITSHGLRVPGNLNVHTRQGWDGDWSTLGGHIQPMLQKARDSCSIMPGLDTVRLGPTVSTASANTDFIGCVLMADGRVFMVPNVSTTARIVDLSTGVVTTPSGTYAGGGTFAGPYYGGCLLQDGRVFMVPGTSTTARIYNPADDTIWDSTTTFTGSYRGAVTLPDGRVYLFPNTGPSAVIFNPSTDTVSTPTGTTGGSFIGGVLMPNGLVLQVPYGSTSAIIVDPSTNAVSTTLTGFGGGYWGATILPDGTVFVVPSNTTTARIVNPWTGAVSSPNVTFPGGVAFAGGCTLPDGRVLLIPYNSTTARVFDPVSQTLTTVSGTFPGNGANFGGVLLPDARVFCATKSGQSQIITAGGWGTYKLPTNVLTSPYLNKM
jgi:hypothetical protein